VKQHKFSTYEDYVKAQCGLTNSKIRRGTGKCKVTEVGEVIKAIHNYHINNVGIVIEGLCHGVRYGQELDLFRKEFGTGTWIGTEITESLCNEIDIIHQDFSIARDDWIGLFNLIYSNSLDHALKPEDTVKTWLSCLNRNGRLYVEWTPWSNKLGGRNNRADCFAANTQEYLSLLDSAGSVQEVLEVKVETEGFTRHVFVVKQKGQTDGITH
jgi:hypothetical protein